MVIVPDRSANTLLPIINRVCRPGTVIYSDEWAAYRQIQERLGFAHEAVNHSVCFVDPNTGVHTQNVGIMYIIRLITLICILYDL